jgi:hypothetical protein
VFYTDIPFCPNCKPRMNRQGKQVGEFLELVKENYSGCGVDIAGCLVCNKSFQISYKVDEIKDLTDTFGPFEE